MPELAQVLGVPVAELAALGVAWHSTTGAWLSPELDADGRLVGIQRRYPDGSKRAVSGGQRGLVYHPEWAERDGSVWLVEGVTDAAALGSLGLSVVGRPSNAGGGVLLAELLEGLDPERPVVVVGERDEKADGRWPGLDGAKRIAAGLAAACARQVLVVLPPEPFKDARAWLNAEGSAATADRWADSVEVVETYGPVADHSAVPAGPVRELADWRAEMLDRKLAAIRSVSGVFLDRSPTGTGKTFSDAVAIAQTGVRALVAVPTHENAAELVETMRGVGLNAVASPKLTVGNVTDPAANCWDGRAGQAASLGLSVQSAVCFRCSFGPKGNKRCDAPGGYLHGLSAASAAPVQVVTHARAAVDSLLVLGEGREVISIHEDCLPVLLPADELTLADVQNAARVVDCLLNSPAALNRRDAKNEDEQQAALELLADGLDVMLSAFDRGQMGPVKLPQVLPGSFGVVALRLLDETVKAQCWTQWGAIQSAFYGAAVSLLSGSRFEAGGERVEVPFLHVARVNSHGDRPKVVLLGDATADAAVVQLALGVDPVEITPAGRLVEKHRVRQVPVDVTRRKSPAAFRKLVAGLLADRPEVRRAGLISHSTLTPALDAMRADGGLGDSLVRVAYFRSGRDRGSNEWVEGTAESERCDGLFVVGTPRLPEGAIRAHLARTGKVAAATRPTPSWGPRPWAALDESGRRVVVAGKGYADVEWEAARRWLSRSDLVQAAGRGRSLLPEGMPVWVLATEECGILLSDTDPGGVAVREGVTDLIRLMRSREGTPGEKGTDPYIAPVGFRSHLTRELAEGLGVTPRAVRNWLRLAELRGLVVPVAGGKGRGGIAWRLVDRAADADLETTPPGEPPPAGRIDSTTDPVPDVVASVSGPPELPAAVSHTDPGPVAAVELPPELPAVQSVTPPASLPTRCWWDAPPPPPAEVPDWLMWALETPDPPENGQDASFEPPEGPNGEKRPSRMPHSRSAGAGTGIYTSENRGPERGG